MLAIVLPIAALVGGLAYWHFMAMHLVALAVEDKASPDRRAEPEKAETPSADGRSKAELSNARATNGDGRDAKILEIRDLPLHLGSWKGEDIPMPKEMLAAAKVDGFVARTYRNELNQRVKVMLAAYSD
ncbi:MAG: exosortase-associated EpsI family protein [Thermoguttaceae bacterium]